MLRLQKAWIDSYSLNPIEPPLNGSLTQDGIACPCDSSSIICFAAAKLLRTYLGSHSSRVPCGFYPAFHINLNKSASTPMAVTAAPAPAPCTINGRAPYLSVWNIMILSEPPRDVANGWLVGYLGNHLISTVPKTVRRTPWRRDLLLKSSPHLSPFDINNTHKPQNLTLVTSARTHLSEFRVEFR
jgi:hypothetical protein